MDVFYGVRMTGPLALYAGGLAGELARLGFTEGSAKGQLGLAAHLSRWLTWATRSTPRQHGTSSLGYCISRARKLQVSSSQDRRNGVPLVLMPAL